MEYRIEKDSMGEIKVPSDKLWGAQTQRSLEHFHISTERMPPELIHALASVKRAAARVNLDLGLLDKNKVENAPERMRVERQLAGLPIEQSVSAGDQAADVDSCAIADDDSIGIDEQNLTIRIQSPQKHRHLITGDAVQRCRTCRRL